MKVAMRAMPCSIAALLAACPAQAATVSGIAAPDGDGLISVSGPAPSGPGQNAALYNGVAVGDVGKILESHVGKGMIVRELIRRPDEGSTPPPAPSPSGDSGERK